MQATWPQVDEYLEDFERAAWQRYRQALGEHELNEAANLCHRGLQRLPHSHRWLLGLGLVFFKRGQTLRAMECAKKAQQIAPHDPLVNKTIQAIQSEKPNSLGYIVGAVSSHPAETLEQSTPVHISRLDSMEEREQHELLFGASLFGAAESFSHGIYDDSMVGCVQRLIRSTKRMMVSWVLIATTVFGIYSLVEAGYAHQQHDVYSHIAEDLRLFLQRGDLVGVSRVLDRLDLDESREVLGQYRDLIIRSEATLYRLFDAEPMRPKRIQRYLKTQKNKAQTHDLVVAQAMLATQLERIAYIPQLEKLDDAGNRDPDVPFLLATAYAAQRRHKRALAAYRRAHDLGPEHLVYFASEVEYLLSKRKNRKARKLVGVMNALNHRSGWTKLCEAKTGLAYKATLSPGLSAVVIARWRLEQARQAQKRDRPKLVEKRLKQAMDKVSQQAPFLLDFYQQLVACGQHDVAARLLALDGWPENSKPARKIAQRWD